MEGLLFARRGLRTVLLEDVSLPACVHLHRCLAGPFTACYEWSVDRSVDSLNGGPGRLVSSVIGLMSVYLLPRAALVGRLVPQRPVADRKFAMNWVN